MTDPREEAGPPAGAGPRAPDRQHRAARPGGETRGLVPRGGVPLAATTWSCPRCDHTEGGTADEPFGDGTCPVHTRVPLVPGRTPSDRRH